MKYLVFGVNGQAGSYTADQLVADNHRVVGVIRRTSSLRLDNLREVIDNPLFELVEGDITDYSSIWNLFVKHKPDRCLFWASQSHVHTSFEQPSLTWQVTAQGVLNILEVMRNIDFPIRLFQASSSEMFGDGVGPDGYQDEDTPMVPNSPYAVAKLAAHRLVRVYRESYGLHASCGILFNFESPRRGENFVTRKITRYVASYQKAQRENKKIVPLRLGNLTARRDWSFAGDTVRAAISMLECNWPDDFVVASGETHSVEEFLLEAFRVICPTMTKRELPIEIDGSLFRPCEVPYLLGYAGKASRVLGWQPTVGFGELVRMMVDADIKKLEGTPT